MKKYFIKLDDANSVDRGMSIRIERKSIKSTYFKSKGVKVWREIFCFHFERVIYMSLLIWLPHPNRPVQSVKNSWD